MNNTINQRIKELINKLNIKKVDFAKSLKITPSYVTLLVNGKGNPSDRLIDDICNKYNVNRDWLIYGNGEMFENLTETEQIMKYTALLLKDTDSRIAKAIKDFILVYQQLDNTSQEVLAQIIESYVKKEKEDK